MLKTALINSEFCVEDNQIEDAQVFSHQVENDSEYIDTYLELDAHHRRGTVENLQWIVIQHSDGTIAGEYIVDFNSYDYAPIEDDGPGMVNFFVDAVKSNRATYLGLALEDEGYCGVVEKSCSLYATYEHPEQPSVVVFHTGDAEIADTVPTSARSLFQEFGVEGNHTFSHLDLLLPKLEAEGFERIAAGQYAKKLIDPMREEYAKKVGCDSSREIQVEVHYGIDGLIYTMWSDGRQEHFDDTSEFFEFFSL